MLKVTQLESAGVGPKPSSTIPAHVVTTLDLNHQATLPPLVSGRHVGVWVQCVSL